MATIEWRCTWATRQRFDELLDYLLSFQEDTDDYACVLEEIKGLPNFPYGYDEDFDEIVPVISDFKL